ncbi:MAG: carboxypeptidase regulatory-like domain-containing protein [Deltaproteobacteria bacterium]|nr:MAG: carboxypeptidase regulatory-like domain-containing protein [Deltaproteobacteria bacterium]
MPDEPANRRGAPRRWVAAAAIALAAALALWWRSAGDAGVRDPAAGGRNDAVGAAPRVPRAAARRRGPVVRAIPAAAYAPLRGRVIRPTGEPVPGATVHLVGRPYAAAAPQPEDRVRTAGADGRFAFERLLTGTYQLEATDGDDVSPTIAHRAAPGAPEAVLVLVPGARVEIEVVDADTAAPVAGASVGLWAGDPEFGDADVSREETTGADGVATFRGVTATANHAVRVRAPGYVPAYEHLVAAAHPNRTWRARVAIAPGARLAGRVVTAAGAPVQGALVAFDPRRQVPLPDGVTSPFLRAGRVDAVTTDAMGRFELTAAEGTGCVTATAPGYQMGERCGVTALRGRPPPEVVIQLEDGGRIEGVVVDADGAPVAAATVVVTQRDMELEPMFEQNFRFRARTDDAGRFAFSGVDRVPVAVYAWTDDASSDLVDVDLTSTPVVAGVHVALVNAGRIAGTVAEPDGSPVPYATVAYRPDHLVDEDGYDAPDVVESLAPGEVPPRWAMLRAKGAVRADADGRFSIAALPPGAYRLIASRAMPTSTSPTYGTAQVRPVFPGDDATIVLPKLTAVRGRVVLRGGSPVREFGVSLALGHLKNAPEMFPPPKWFVAPDGRFVLARVPDGRYRLRVTGPGIEDTYIEEPFEVDGRDVDLGDIVVRRGIARSGVVVDADGRPVAKARVSVAVRGRVSTLESDADGRFALPTLAAGVPLRVKASTDDAASDWIDVGEAQTTVEVRLAEAATGGISGALVDPGQPVDQRAVAVTDVAAASPDDMPPVAVVKTEAGGLFSFPALPVGRYRLWVYRVGTVEENEAAGRPTWFAHPDPVAVAPGRVTEVVVVVRRGGGGEEP